MSSLRSPQLELLVSHTDKYVDDVLLERTTAAQTAFGHGDRAAYNSQSFDEAEVLATIRKSEPFAKLTATIQATEKELRNANDPEVDRREGEEVLGRRVAAT